ncbi:MAG: DUF1501 domain-containing protein, partial [Pirellulales bacterium]
MFVFEDTVLHGRRLARRPFLQVGAGCSAVSLASCVQPFHAKAAETIQHLARDRSVIFLFMHGGPSQFETFDPKQDGPPHSRSVNGEIASSVPGVHFGSTFERLAKRAHLFNVVRSFVTGNGNHDIKPIVGKATLGANMGSLFAKTVGPLDVETAMPSNVALFPKSVSASAGPAITQFGDFTAAGALGAATAPLVPGGEGPFLDTLRLQLSQERLGDRKSLLASLDQGRRWIDQPQVRSMLSDEGLAFDVLARGVADAFSLDGEGKETIARYDTASRFNSARISTQWNNHKHYVDHNQSIGKLLLLARRLCERGCGFVTVTTSFVWDMHSDKNNASMREGMGYVGSPFDYAVSTLIDDIEARGLQDKILLVCCGEMGRTPRINAKGGRDHWGGLAPLLIYGGGLEAGRIIGQSTRD